MFVGGRERSHLHFSKTDQKEGSKVEHVFTIQEAVYSLLDERWLFPPKNICILTIDDPITQRE